MRANPVPAGDAAQSEKRCLSAIPPDRRRQARERRAARANPAPANNAAYSEKDTARRSAGRRRQARERRAARANPAPPTMPRSPKKDAPAAPPDRHIAESPPAGKGKASCASQSRPGRRCRAIQKKCACPLLRSAAGRQGNGEPREPIPPKRECGRSESRRKSVDQKERQRELP